MLFRRGRRENCACREFCGQRVRARRRFFSPLPNGKDSNFGFIKNKKNNNNNNNNHAESLDLYSTTTLSHYGLPLYARVFVLRKPP